MVPKGLAVVVELLPKVEVVVFAEDPNPVLPNALVFVGGAPGAAPKAEFVDCGIAPKGEAFDVLAAAPNGEAFEFEFLVLPKAELPNADVPKPAGFVVLFENADVPNAEVFAGADTPKLELPNADVVLLAALPRLELPNPADPKAPPVVFDDPNPELPNPLEPPWLANPLLPKPVLVAGAAGLLSPLLPNPAEPNADPVEPPVFPNPVDPKAEPPLALFTAGLAPNPLLPNAFPPPA